MKHLLITFLFFSVFKETFCQKTEIITVKKNRPLTFFQQGIKRDTISKNAGDVFYLQVPDSLLPHLIISVENAKLDSYKGDTLLLLTYLPGHKYESFFTKEEDEKTGREFYKFSTAVNGATAMQENHICIVLTDKRYAGRVILRNNFVYERK